MHLWWVLPQAVTDASSLTSQRLTSWGTDAPLAAMTMLLMVVHCSLRQKGRTLTLSRGSAYCRNQAATAWPASWKATVLRSSLLITCVREDAQPCA